LQEALKKLIIHNTNYQEEKNISLKEIKEKFEPHIGFEKEKSKFTDYIYAYSKTHGEFYPQREIICYAGAPGTGKTSFIGTLKDAMGRKAATVSCAGLKEFTNYSILGDKNKPSLAA
ncbi:1556_t:CDS:1, partial [Funneliformis geosporum]